ncbi:MAG TPA: NAD(P)-dependent oxidoreductase, partial [Casimicrobiaceae bacterium]|nr:NAD(P)-dependent oxidoreductase [Casimicrobiaceae bacterium]
MSTTPRVAFLGLGVMGHPMAGHLARAGLAVTVCNRTADKARGWVEQYGGASARTPAAAAESAEIVMMCVGNDHDVRSVALGPDGALSTMREGAILVDHTTASAEIAREIHAKAKAKGVAFLDAPVSGGQAGAENGKLTIMVGGDADAFATVEPVLRNYGRAVTLMGGPGSGQLTKMFNQICIAGLVQALAEGIAFAQKAGLDVERALEVIGKGAAQSWQMDNRGRTMVA